MLLWIIGIVGTLGVAGTIAAAVLAPSIAIPIIESVMRFVLSCKPCLVALAILASLFGGALYGANVERGKCREGQLAAKLAAQQADLDAARQSAEDELKRSKLIEANANDQHEKDAAYIASLQVRPACTLDDSDVGGVPDHRRSWPRRARAANPAR